MAEISPHFHLIEIMEGLGYKANKGGTCFGVAHMGKQAVLSSDLVTFGKRLQLCLDHSTQELKEFLAFYKRQDIKIIKDSDKSKSHPTSVKVRETGFALVH